MGLCGAADGRIYWGQGRKKQLCGFCSPDVFSLSVQDEQDQEQPGVEVNKCSILEVLRWGLCSCWDWDMWEPSRTV